MKMCPPPVLIKNLALLGFSGSVVLATNPAQALNLINNGSFENSSLGSGFNFVTLSAGSTAINDWTVTSGSIDYINQEWQASDGGFSLDLSGKVNDAGSIAQTFATTLGNQYLVSFDLAGNLDPSPRVKTLRLSAGGSSQDFTFDVTGKTVTDMGWSSQNFSFVASGNSTTLSFTSLNNSGAGPALDNIVVTAVPWETDALPVVGSTILFGFGVWRKSKPSQKRDKDL
jgi:choice-of-anchor C domain-containing protein